MGFDLSEFYEIYGHDLEVEARQEQQRFQQRLLGWVQTWNNTLCSLYDTAVNRVQRIGLWPIWSPKSSSTGALLAPRRATNGTAP